MAIRSMTGYGGARIKSGACTAEAEISSVNRKQADIRFDLPKSIADREAELLAMLRGKISRGSVLCRVFIAASHGADAPHLDMALASAYVRRLRKAGRRLGLVQDLGVAKLIELPGVVSRKTGEDSPGAWRAAKLAVAKALAALVRSRETEGAALAADMLGRAAKISARLERIAKLAPLAQAKNRRRLAERMKEAGINAGGDDPRILREAALLADKCDISEEIVRLKSHLAQTSARLKSGVAPGRELDFLAQEMARETNTMGAKAGDIRISRLVIKIKTELERLREQTQNIE